MTTSQIFRGKQDELRYVLTSLAPEQRDSEFTWKQYQAQVNNELVAILGNFVNRTLVLTNKYYDGIVPEGNSTGAEDKAVLAQIPAILKQMSESSIEKFRFREGLAAMMELARTGNGYLAKEEPWKVVKEDPERVKSIMYTAVQLCAAISIIMEPYLPYGSDRLKKMLNAEELAWSDLNKEEFIASGHKIGKVELLYQKIEDDVIDKQIEKLVKQSSVKEQVEQETEFMDFETFSKMQMLIGTITEAEKPEGSKKLLKLQVDLGHEKRTVMSGIAEHYEPENIIGQQVTLLANLAPRKIMGIESQGMILMAEDTEGKLVFVQPSDAIANGAEVS